MWIFDHTLTACFLKGRVETHLLHNYLCRRPAGLRFWPRWVLTAWEMWSCRKSNPTTRCQMKWIGTKGHISSSAMPA